MTDFPSGTGSGSISDLVTQFKLANQNMSQLIQTIGNLFPRTFGTFTLSASASTTISNTSVVANSIPVWIPTNAAAGTLEGSSKKLYLSARSAGTSFTVTTASGVAAAGTEQFAYFLMNPV